MLVKEHVFSKEETKEKKMSFNLETAYLVAYFQTEIGDELVARLANPKSLEVVRNFAERLPKAIWRNPMKYQPAMAFEHFSTSFQKGEMSFSSAIIDLQKEIGKELFWALIEKRNAKTVRNFASTLDRWAEKVVRLKLGDRVFDLALFLDGTSFGRGDLILGETKNIVASSLNESQGRYFIGHREEISEEILKGKLVFFFPNSPYKNRRGQVTYFSGTNPKKLWWISPCPGGAKVHGRLTVA